MGAFQGWDGSVADRNRFLGSTIFSSRAFFSGKAWRIALVAIAGLAGTATAEAAVFWSDEDPMVMSPMPPQPQIQRPRKPKRS